ncbi:GlxA family transcriptional regulator [Hoeflea sp. TYP-13]|uniref:GlxA family transcriptional regulator n=1 Tax=Hoeflea sp. TYP-13 TaxID=3230023 RepID=UPI0034C61C2F
MTGTDEFETKLVLMVAFDGASALDIVGPLDILSGTTSVFEGGNSRYDVKVATLAGGPVRTSPGGLLIMSEPLEAFSDKQIDTLMVSGGLDMAAARQDRTLISWIAENAPRARRTASVCTGAFLLAEAGLLDGKTATTHWYWADEFAASFPDVKTEPDAIFMKDGNTFTSAGITTGMDMALALVEEDHGREVALDIARNWVMFLKRPGGQSQFSSFLPRQQSSNRSITALQNWMMDNLSEDLCIERLAERMCMSTRNFARLFTSEVGISPGRYVEELRLHAAKRHLESTSIPIDAIAAASGFGNAERMRRTFVRRLKVNPQQFRSRFQRSAGDYPPPLPDTLQ